MKNKILCETLIPLTKEVNKNLLFFSAFQLSILWADSVTSRKWEIHENIFKIFLPQIDQEGMLQALHYLQLSENIANFISLNALLFIHILHGIHFLGVSLLYNAHLIGTKEKEKFWHLEKVNSIVTLEKRSL